MSTEPDVTAIEARAAAATPGPWEARTNIAGVKCLVDMREKPATFAATHTDEPDSMRVDAANAEFIAHARTDIPDLLAALKASRAREAALTAKVARYEVRCVAQTLCVALADDDTADR